MGLLQEQMGHEVKGADSLPPLPSPAPLRFFSQSYETSPEHSSSPLLPQEPALSLLGPRERGDNGLKLTGSQLRKSGPLPGTPGPGCQDGAGRPRRTDRRWGMRRGQGTCHRSKGGSRSRRTAPTSACHCERSPRLCVVWQNWVQNPHRPLHGKLWLMFLLTC